MPVDGITLLRQGTSVSALRGIRSMTRSLDGASFSDVLASTRDESVSSTSPLGSEVAITAGTDTSGDAGARVPSAAIAPADADWSMLSPVAMPDGVLPVETPGLLRTTGNADADELVDHVMRLRTGKGMAAGDSDRDVAAAQSLLVAQGYTVGSFGPYGNGVDGILGPVTSEALSRFQQDRGLAVTGTLTAETAARLSEDGAPALDAITARWQEALAASPFSATAHQGTANPFWYVRFIAEEGDQAATMGNIDPVFKGRLAALARDAGQVAEFGEGLRDLARQAELYQRYLDGTGALAAKPGQSLHNMGLAVDTKSAWLLRLGEGMPVARQTALQEYGLCKPLADGEGSGREAWHLVPVEAHVQTD